VFFLTANEEMGYNTPTEFFLWTKCQLLKCGISQHIVSLFIKRLFKRYYFLTLKNTRSQTL